MVDLDRVRTDADVSIRPLTDGEVEVADRLAWDALSVHVPAEHAPPDEDVRRRHGRLRIGHLLRTDPGGAWLAERGRSAPEPVGIALALVREGLWGLSLLAVAPAHQGRGIGRRLLARALEYRGAGDPVSPPRHPAGRPGIILSSPDPRAMRTYALAGFALRPAVGAGGMVDRCTLPSGLRARAGDPVSDRATCERASRAVRGAAHGDDVARLAEAGGELLVIPGRGFVVRRDGAVALLAAEDEEAARDLLWSALAAVPPGMPAHVDYMTGAQDWAVDVVLRAGLQLSPDGPVFVRGDVGPLRPYLPSGAYL